MINLNKIKVDFAPRKKALASLPAHYVEKFEPYMTEFESAFLCGLLQKYKPKKIVEVGVATGGTTAIILQCLEDIGQEYIMKSIDIMEAFHADHSKKTGFLGEHLKQEVLIPAGMKGSHEFYLGTMLPFVLEEIGNEIDFAIFDTTHVLPGEMLDFLAILPYLKNDAVICLHDISLTQDNTIIIDGTLMNYVKGDGHFHENATSVLLSCVTAEKYLNLITDNDFRLIYPNIAAFQINSDTMKYIESVFLGLVNRWLYLPSLPSLKAYMEIFLRYYPQELTNIFQEILRMNIKNISKSLKK